MSYSSSASSNILLRSISIAAEQEDCILSTYVTTKEQRKVLRSLFVSLGMHNTQSDDASMLDAIPISWKIEIADEYSGWYDAKAKQFYAFTKQILIEVLDMTGKETVFEGLVPVDPRVVRLTECEDEYSQALFNQIVRDSVMKVKWELDWYDTSPLKKTSLRITGRSSTLAANKWHHSTARYYIPILNALLVEDYLPISFFHSCDNLSHSDEEEKGLAMVYIDHNVRLCSCETKKRMSDFVRLILEEGIKCSVKAREQVSDFLKNTAVDNVASSSTKAMIAPACTPSAKKKRSAGLCVICMERNVKTVAFVPCGHMLLCEQCLDLVPAPYESTPPLSCPSSGSSVGNGSAATDSSFNSMNSTISECPLCRQEIHSKLLVYSR